MAVTITRAQLAARMRLGRTQIELDEVDHLLAEATAAVIRLAPDCPDVIHNMAVWRYASYSYDRPVCQLNQPALATSCGTAGPQAALLPYRNHRLGLSGDGEDEDATPADPGGGAIGAEGTINWPGLS